MSFDPDEEPTTPHSYKTSLKDAALNVESNVKKSGVIYLSSIPPGMNVSKLREIMSQYGALGRIYLEPDQKGASVETGTVAAFRDFFQGGFFLVLFCRSRQEKEGHRHSQARSEVP